MKFNLTIITSIIILIFTVSCNGNLNQTNPIENNTFEEQSSITIDDLRILKDDALNVLSNNTPGEIQTNINQVAPGFAKAIAANNVTKSAMHKAFTNKAINQNGFFFNLDKLKGNSNNKAISTDDLLNDLSLISPESIDKIENIPYFAMEIWKPELLENYSGPIWVIPYQYPLDGSQVQEMIGYDENGNQRLFNGKERPDFPVFILKISERVDYLLDCYQKQEMKYLKPNSRAVVYDGTKTIRYILKGLYIYTTTEDWWVFWDLAAEIYVLYVSGNIGIKQPYEAVNYEKRWYDLNDNIFEIPNEPGNSSMKMAIWETDFNWGQYIPRKVSGQFIFAGVEYSLSYEFDTSNLITSADDFLGETYVSSMTLLDANNLAEFLVGSAKIRYTYIVY